MPLTNAEKQRLLRERRAAEGKTEVRGIYARTDNHKKIKAYAEKLDKKTKKT